MVLNTKLFPAMVCEKANEKNVRISAMEEGEVRLEEYSCKYCAAHLLCLVFQIKIFLISCSPKDADKLFTALEYRISQVEQQRVKATLSHTDLAPLQLTTETDSDSGPPPEKKQAGESSKEI